MSDLVERLEGAERGSDELSARVLLATLAPAGARIEQSSFNGAWCIYTHPERPRIWQAPTGLRGVSVTESIDAVMSLAGRVLGEKEALLILADVLGDPNDDLLSLADLPVRICAAILRARQNTGEEG